MRAEDLRHELFRAVRAFAPRGEHGGVARDDEIVTYLDSDRPIPVVDGYVVDAHGQRVDQVRASVAVEGGIHVLVLASANGKRGLVAGTDALTHFYAFIPGGRIEARAEPDAETADESAADSDAL